MRVNKIKLVNLVVFGSLCFTLNTANSLAAGKVEKALAIKGGVDLALKAGGHRDTDTFIEQGNHSKNSKEKKAK